jgi:hypothetical protein
MSDFLGLGAIEEYNNAGALIGLDAMMEDPELLGALQRMRNPVARVKTIAKLADPGARSRGSRAEMERHFKELPPHIKEAVYKGELRLADSCIYSVKPVNSKTIKLFETQDDKETGLRNISNAKLPKNMALLVSGIYLMAGVSADTSPDKVKAIQFKDLGEFPALANGEFSLKFNKRQIVPESPNVVFKSTNNHNVPLGYYKLHNPRVIVDDVQIELTVELGTMEGIAPNTYIYAALHGTLTTP